MLLLYSLTLLLPETQVDLPSSFLRVLSQSVNIPVLVSIMKISTYLTYCTRKFPSVALRGKDGSRILLYDTLGRKVRQSKEGQVVLGSGKGESGSLVDRRLES